MPARSVFPTKPTTEGLVRGDPWDIPVEIRVEGAPVDVTGWVWQSTVRVAPDWPTVAAAFDVETVDGPAGQLILHLDGADTQALKEAYVFDLKQLEPTLRTWWIARLRVRKGVSRPEPAP